MTWEELQIYFKGKLFLIGLTFIDHDDRVVEQYQTSGIVAELTDEGFIRLNRSDGSIFQIPYDKSSINKAAEGEYSEKSTGNIIVNPDYLTFWTIHVKTTDNLDDMKQNGFSPQNWVNEKN